MSVNFCRSDIALADSSFLDFPMMMKPEASHFSLVNRHFSDAFEELEAKTIVMNELFQFIYICKERPKPIIMLSCMYLYLNGDG